MGMPCFIDEINDTNGETITLSWKETTKDEPEFLFNGQCFSSLYEFSLYLEMLALDCYTKFQDFVHCLIDSDNNLNAQFENWLIAIGKSDELNQWKNSLN